MVAITLGLIVTLLGVIDGASWLLTGQDLVEHATGVDLFDEAQKLVGIDPGPDTFQQEGGLLGMTGVTDAFADDPNFTEIDGEIFLKPDWQPVDPLQQAFDDISAALSDLVTGIQDGFTQIVDVINSWGVWLQTLLYVSIAVSVIILVLAVSTRLKVGRIEKRGRI